MGFFLGKWGVGRERERGATILYTYFRTAFYIGRGYEGVGRQVVGAYCIAFMFIQYNDTRYLNYRWEGDVGSERGG